MTSDQGKSIIKNGWNVPRITGVIESGLENLLSIDLFAEIDPLVTEPTLIQLVTESPIPEEEIAGGGYARDWHDDSDEKWEIEGQDETRSAFDIFDDVSDDGEWTFITNKTLNVFRFFFILDFVSKIKKCMDKF